MFTIWSIEVMVFGGGGGWGLIGTSLFGVNSFVVYGVNLFDV